jgi:hypothetical protein
MSDSVTPTGGDGIRAEVPDEKDGRLPAKHRLHQHLEDHRDGEQHDGAADLALGEVLLRSVDGFLDRSSRATVRMTE